MILGVILAERDRLEADGISGNQTVRQMVSVLTSARVTECVLVAEGGNHQKFPQLSWFSGGIVGCINPADRLEAVRCVIRSPLPEAHHGLMICPMTTPELTQSLVVDILQGFWRTRKNLIVPLYAGQRGYPLIIGEPLYPKLEKVSSLESLAESCPDEVHEVMLPEAGLASFPVSASRSSSGLHP